MWLSLLLIPLTLYLLGYGVLHSNTANRYLVERVAARVPGLTLTSGAGNLLRGLELDAEYRNPSIHIAITDATLRLGLQCLWLGALCVEELSIHTLSIDVPPGENTADPAVKTLAPLASVKTPLPLIFRRLQLSSLQVRRAAKTVFELQQLNLNANWDDHRIYITEARGQLEACPAATLRGEIQLQQFYPLRALLRCSTATPLGILEGSFDGDLRRLDISWTATGDWLLQGHGDFSALDASASLAIQARLLRPVSLQDGQLELQRGEFQLRGDFQHQTLDLDIGFSAPQWPGDNHLQLRAAVDRSASPASLRIALQTLQGELMQRQLGGNGEIIWNNDHWQLPELELRQAQNHLRLSGTYHTDNPAETRLKAQVDFPTLQLLWAPLSGTLAGEVAVSGNLQSPGLQGQLDVQNLHFRDNALKAGQALFQLKAGQARFQLSQLGRTPSKAEFSLQGLKLGSMAAGNLQLNARGTHAQHQLEAHWQQPNGLSGSLSCEGRLAPPTLWQNRCNGLELTVKEQHWALNQPVKFQQDFAANITHLQPVCLHQVLAGTSVEHSPSLCTSAELTIAANAIRGLSVKGLRLPWQLLASWFPDGFQPRGIWQFNLAGDVIAGKPSINASIESIGSELQWQLPEAPLSIPLNQLKGELALREERLAVRWSGDAGDYGQVKGDLSLGPTEIGGNIDITEARLEPLQALLATAAPEVTSLAGRLSADILVSGPRTRPRLQGNIRVSDARTTLDKLPVPVEDLQLNIEFDQQNATLNGKFQIASAPARLSGNLTWADAGWQGQLSLAATEIPLVPDENTEITLSPAVDVKATPGKYQVNGEVIIPRARIRLRQLPAQAIRPSPDTVIIESQATASPTESGTELHSDITLVLGDDVVFQGFGLDTRLRGQLTLKQTPATGTQANGVVKLIEGRYRAYGQALLIRQGDLIFVGDPDNPQVRVEAIREMDDDAVVVGLRATGAARQPIITLFSQPEMAQQAKLHYLLTGQPPGTSVETNPEHLAAQTALSLGISTSGAIVNKSARALGIDNVRISAEQGQQGPEVRLSGYLSSNLLVRYGIGVFDAVNSLTLRYKVGRNLYIEAISGESNSLDLLWSFDR